MAEYICVRTSLGKVTYDIMEPDTPAPHPGVPLAHAGDDIFVEVVDEHATEYCTRPQEDI